MPRSEVSCLSDRDEAAARPPRDEEPRQSTYFGCIRIPASNRTVAAFM